MPKSSICSFHEYGNVVSNFVSERVQGAFPAKTASTIGGAGNAGRKKTGHKYKMLNFMPGFREIKTRS